MCDAYRRNKHGLLTGCAYRAFSWRNFNDCDCFGDLRPQEKTAVPPCVSFQLVTAKSFGSRAPFDVT